MDEIELLVEETFKHFSENFDFLESEKSSIVTKKSVHDSDSLPERPGIIYHVQKTVCFCHTCLSLKKYPARLFKNFGLSGRLSKLTDHGG